MDEELCGMFFTFPAPTARSIVLVPWRRSDCRRCTFYHVVRRKSITCSGEEIHPPPPPLLLSRQQLLILIAGRYILDLLSRVTRNNAVSDRSRWNLSQKCNPTCPLPSTLVLAITPPPPPLFCPCVLSVMPHLKYQWLRMRVQLHDYDRFGADDFIGQTIIDLEDRWFSRGWHELEREDPVAYERREAQGAPYKPLEVRDLSVPSSEIPQGQVYKCEVQVAPIAPKVVIR